MCLKESRSGSSDSGAAKRSRRLHRAQGVLVEGTVGRRWRRIKVLGRGNWKHEVQDVFEEEKTA